MCCLHMVLFTSVDHHVLPPHGFISLCGSSCAASTWFYLPLWIIMCCLHMVLFPCVDLHVLSPHGFIYQCRSSCAASTWFYLPVWIIMCCCRMVLFTCVDHHVLPPHGFVSHLQSALLTLIALYYRPVMRLPAKAKFGATQVPIVHDVINKVTIFVSFVCRGQT